MKLYFENWALYLLILFWLFGQVLSIYLAKTKKWKLKDSQLSSEVNKKQCTSSKRWQIFFVISAICANLAILLCLFVGLIDSFDSNFLLLIFIFSIMGATNGLRVLFPITTSNEQNTSDGKENFGIGLILSSFAVAILVLSKLNNVRLIHYFSIFVLIGGTIFLIRSLKKEVR